MTPGRDAGYGDETLLNTVQAAPASPPFLLYVYIDLLIHIFINWQDDCTIWL